VVAGDVDDLFTAAPEEFVAARNALAKSLRASGQKEAAAEIAGLRRPTVSDWALNVVAHRHPDAVAALLDAAAELRRIQAGAIEGRGGDVRGALGTMRAAATAVHRQADDVLAGAGRDRGAQAAAITGRLAEVAANEEIAEQLRAGRLGTAPVGDADPFAGLEPGPLAPRATKKPAGATKATKPARAEPDEEPTRPRPDPAERRRLERAAAEARRAQSAAEAALAKAQARLEEAHEAQAAAESRRDEARAAVAEAEAAVARHERGDART
jgi:hypothetical protein